MKKRIILASFLLLTVVAYTQNEDLDTQLENIDKSSVTSGIIYERVLPLANLYSFNYEETHNTASFDFFKTYSL